MLVMSLAMTFSTVGSCFRVADSIFEAIERFTTVGFLILGLIEGEVNFNDQETADWWISKDCSCW